MSFNELLFNEGLYGSTSGDAAPGGGGHVLAPAMRTVVVKKKGNGRAYRQVFYQDDGASLEYTVNWTAWIGTDEIVASAWDVSAPMAQPFPPTFGLKTATVWLTGGEVDERYIVTNTVITVGGRSDSRSFYVIVLPYVLGGGTR